MPLIAAAPAKPRPPGVTLVVTKATPSGMLPLGIIARSEIRFIFFFTLSLCVITSLPYVTGRFISVPGTVFTGVLQHDTDSNNYLAYANQAASGKWLFHNPMTGEPHRAVFFNLEWLLIGKTASWLHVSLPFAMNLQRLLCIALMTYGVYWLSTSLFHSVLVRRVALVAIMAGGGFGWLAALHLLRIRINSSYFLDLTAGLQFPFYWALKLPHFLVAESFVVLGLGFFLRAERCRRTLDYIAAGLCYLLAGTCRPYDMLYLMAATTLYVALRYWQGKRARREIFLRALPALMCLPLLSYYYWIFKIHPVFRWWSLPGRAAPAPWLLALSFGMAVPLLLLSLWKLRHGSDTVHFLGCCLITAVLLTYSHRFLHFSFQFATDILVPLVMVVLAGLEEPVREWSKKGRWTSACIAALLLVNSFTSIALTGQNVILAAKGDFRVDRQLLEAYSWLNGHSQVDELVLADFENSNHIPQYAHNNVYCGYINAVRFGEKAKALDQFFAPETSNDFRDQLIGRNTIRVVLLTPTEEQSLAAFARSPRLKEVFRNNTAAIYWVPIAGSGSQLASPGHSATFHRRVLSP
jgi:hypothetical protein